MSWEAVPEVHVTSTETSVTHAKRVLKYVTGASKSKGFLGLYLRYGYAGHLNGLHVRGTG